MDQGHEFMNLARPRRSALYLPASNARAIEKSRSLPCDVVILDLEDAVAPDAKILARTQACTAAREGGFGTRELIIRVNGLETPWGADDLEAAGAAGADAVLVPKVACPADIAAYAGTLPAAAPIWLMIETCRSLFHLDAIGATSAASRVVVWVIGSNDLAKEMQCRPGVARTPLIAPLSLAVAAARAHGLAILDGVTNDINDADTLALQCAQGAEMGFDGKTLIHPSQIDAANHAFSPDAAEIAWSRTIVAAFAAEGAADKGVLRVDGRMVERLHLARARQVIAVSDAIAARG
jgi:citrate lyase subunit beta/citryl-CoA lyase